MKSIKTALFGIFAAFILASCADTPPIHVPPIPPIQLPTPIITPPPTTPCLSDCENDNGDSMLNPPDEVNYRTTEFRSNYGLLRTNADSSYSRRYFGAGVTVGVMDTGVRTTHRELSGNVVAGRDFVFPGTPITDPDGHGTAVAAVIAGKRDSVGMHGVAPSARIMPLKIGDSSGRLVGNWRDGLRHAVSQNVPIVNSSFGDIGEELIGDYQGTTYRVEVPFLRGFFNDNRRALAREVAGIVRNRDIVAVFAAGNGGWNARTGRIRLYQCAVGQERRPQNCQGPHISITRNQFVTGFDHKNHYDYAGNTVRGEGFLSGTDGSDIPDLSSYYSSLPMWSINDIDSLLDGLERGTISESAFANALVTDSNFNTMRGRWLAVVATDSNNQIASFSNGCGLSILWCLAAPGESIFTADTSAGDVGYNNYNGTSFAAPHVSGALALLKSAAPELRMTVIRNVLLTTATDLGDSGVDEVYGWGLVNVSAGIATLNGMQIPATAGRNAVAVRDLREGLPGELSHVRGRMSDVSVAVQITDDYYENIALSDIVGGDSQKTKLGNAAKEMQADDFTAGESFRFWGGLEYDGSRSSYIGEGGGIFSAENASDTGGYVKWTTKNYGGISAFGEYGRTQIKADYDSASFISQIQNARAEEWTAGFQYQNLFLHNDSLQFSARQESRISGGEMVLHYPVADGDSHKAFIGESVQTIRTETARIPIKQKPQTIYTAGYSQKTENSKWSAAAEWNAATNAKGVSFAVELQIR